MPNWTQEQKQAIYLDGSNILVSAGAGSGKTAVLSERVLRKVEDGIDIDRILILTFTKAAAYEMMLRIRGKLAKAGYQEQVQKIDKAYITTFDSFALSILKKYHYVLNLSSDIKIIDENAISLYKKEVLDSIMDEYYQKEDVKFQKLITDFCTKEDKKLREYILSLNEKLSLKYDRKEYLRNYVEENYKKEKIESYLSEYETLLLTNVRKIEEQLKKLELELDSEPYLSFYDPISPLLESKTYEEMKKNVDIELPRLPNKSSESVKNAKEEIKKLLDEIKEWCHYSSTDAIIEEYVSTKDYIETIISIMEKLDQKVWDYKIAYQSFEFIDISKLAINLVQKYPEIREELKNFFHEIMIDEYQDTSDLQEKFISCIANHNVYMVGDIKQSIYRFRNANPLIFKEKYNQYTKEIGGRKIDLNKNFRSRSEVLKNINDIFDFIMDEDFGGASYKESHQMIFGNQSYIEEGLTKQDYNIDFYHYQIEKDSDYKKYGKEEIEAFIIAQDMKRKVEEKFQVFDKDTKILRNIEYKDFVILMDRSSKFTTYKKIFEYMQVPLLIWKDENIAEDIEVSLLMHILRLIECVEKKEIDTNRFRYSYVSLARSYLYQEEEEKILETVKENNYLETDIFKKVLEIVNELASFNLKTLLEKIVLTFSFDEKLITIGNVESGFTVLEYFLEIAKNLETLNYDYHDFIHYLENIIKTKSEIKIPVSVGTENSAKIMTIHKSKGLEYPICYYSGLSSSFNVSDLKDKMLFDSDYGFIMPSYIHGYQDIFTKTLLKKKFYQEEIGEKIRLFYVALTRCKEKMIVVSSFEEEECDLEEGIVGANRKEKYRSFASLLKSIYENIESRMIKVDLEKIPLNSHYKMTSKKELEKISSEEFPSFSEYLEQTEVIENHKFSKETNQVITQEEKEKMKFGTRIHEIFEFTDFKNPNLDILSHQEQIWIKNFLNQPLLKDIREAKILKEYEFYHVEEESKKHGIIDLLLEYHDHIDIIDYKLKHVKDKAYLEQLKGYQTYIEKKTKKKADIYLYSILDNEMVPAESQKKIDDFVR